MNEIDIVLIEIGGFIEFRILNISVLFYSYRETNPVLLKDSISMASFYEQLGTKDYYGLGNKEFYLTSEFINLTISIKFLGKI